MKKYFFSRDKWVEEMGESKSKIFTWPSEIDGAEVFFSEPTDELGKVKNYEGKEYLVVIRWCDEVEVDAPEGSSSPSNECEYCNP